MTKAASRGAEVEEFILAQVAEHPADIAKVTATQFGISRQAANKHLARLVTEGKLTAQGSTKSRTYAEPLAVHESLDLPVSKKLEEHWVWRERVEGLLKDLPKNVVDICHYGFTEMLNNVIDHSGSPTVRVQVDRTDSEIVLRITDTGVGIFRKLVEHFGFHDEQEAALELSKGKLTTDPKNHSGEGIFFSSRAFDSFWLLSVGLAIHVDEGTTWLLDDKLFTVGPGLDQGTGVVMKISTTSPRTLEGVFEEGYANKEDFRFSRTRVPVALAQVGDENLISRSQAKRLLARLDRFEDVTLDFRGVESIGQAFADEIFRVFAAAHPQVRLTASHTTPGVQRMIKRALSLAEENRGAS